MQFIEKNSFNVRSAIYTLSNSKSPVKFIIFPMIHVGSKQYYDEIRFRLNKCDYIVFESVKSVIIDYVTWSYKIIEKIKRFNLVTQKYLDIRPFNKKLIHGDISEKEFNESWFSIPILFKLKLLMTIPFYVIFLILFGTKEFITRRLQTEDLLSRNDILNRDNESENYYKTIVDIRDEKVIQKIDEFCSKHTANEVTVGIVYGAKHMRAITHFLLSSLGYRIKNSEWIIVFDFN